MQKIKIHAKISADKLPILDEIASNEKRSRSSMVDILLDESIDERIERVQNRNRELREELNDIARKEGEGL